MAGTQTAPARAPRLRIGLALDWGTERTTLDQLLREYVPLIQLAERLGFDSIWVGQHYPTGPDLFHLPSPLLVLAALAPQTSLTLGTGVLLLPTLNPLTLAYEAAVLDQLCGGRLILGMGIGRQRDWQKFGLEREIIGQRMDEMLLALRALWSGAEGFEGQVVKIHEPIWPKPIQPNGPPLWVGGSIGRAIRRAATLGDGWYAGSSHHLQAIATTAARYRQELGTAGKNPATGRVAANRSCIIAETMDAALEQGGPFVEEVLHIYNRLGSMRTPGGEPITDETQLLPLVAEEVCLIGTPDSVSAKLEEYAAAGVTDVALRMAPMSLPREHVERSIRLAGEQVIPRFQ